MKTKQTSKSYLIGLGITQAIPTLGWLLEQYVSQAMPIWWSNVPWGWLFICVLTTWLGFLLSEFARKDSSVRDRIRNGRDIARISFSIERPTVINEAQTASVEIEIKKPLRQLGCYARVAHPEYYLSGRTEWKWAKQVTLCEEGRDISPGKIIKQALITISRADEQPRRIEALGRELPISDSPFEQIVAVEILVTSKSKTVRRREIFQIVQSAKPTFIPSEPQDTDEYIDA